jgi:putative transposase
MPMNRKVTRLAPAIYIGQQSYFVTICCDRRTPHLREPTTARRVIVLLQECAVGHAFLLHAFCLMPDHAHMLVEGTHPQCDLREFVRLFKQRSSFEFRKSHHQALWEMSYYDHILRREDHLEDVACYIWQNPVRKALSLRPEDFVYSGSQTIDWMMRSARLTPGNNWHPPWK